MESKKIITVVLLGFLLAFNLSCSLSTPKKVYSNQQATNSVGIEDDLQIIDISQLQLRMYNEYVKEDSIKKVKALRDSLYYPYQDIWDGYVGGVNGFDATVEHYGIRKLNELNEKNKLFYLENRDEALLDAFDHVRDGMITLTGFSPKGKWYLLYGPSLANLGSVGGGLMFIDFAFPENTSLDAVINWFPHEINHQIHDNLCPDKTYNVLSRSINEGFATYVNKLYWNEIAKNEAYSVAMSLFYTEEELSAAEQDWDFIISYFKQHYLSTDKKMIDQFGSSNQKLKEGLPGKIGYLIGYRIIESYVSKHGDESWKNIYTMNYLEILEQSGFLKP